MSSHVADSRVVVSLVSVFLAVDGRTVGVRVRGKVTGGLSNLRPPVVRLGVGRRVRVRFRVWVSVRVVVSVRWIRRRVELRVPIR